MPCKEVKLFIDFKSGRFYLIDIMVKYIESGIDWI